MASNKDRNLVIMLVSKHRRGLRAPVQHNDKYLGICGGRHNESVK